MSYFHDMIIYYCTGPGISDFGLNLTQDEETWKHFRNCMRDVIEKIPASKHNSTPISLGATAGMRLLQYVSQHDVYVTKAFK